MFGLISLPYEVLSNIIESLSFDDVFSLGRTCKAFTFLVREESICKTIVHTKIRYSNEALGAMTLRGDHARAVRRVAKRRDALATASPFSVATIGFCDAYLYCKGVLCYTLDDRVRILDLHRSAQSELVINIPGLLTHAISDLGDNSKGVFQILYYSDGIISCIYKTSGLDSTAWLITFHLRTRNILVSHELDSTDKIFVRHNKQYLYYGTHSEIGTDGNKKWILHGYELRTRKWFEEKIHLHDMVGSEIGSTICFEFYDNYFYAVSNQTSFEVEEIDWTSFYHCVRFPLNSPCKALLEKTEDKSMWRRQHQEGPIDDRWTSLRLDVDESTGNLRIVESRKEWYLGSSKSLRTYYKTDIVFPQQFLDEDLYTTNSPNISSQDSDAGLVNTHSWVARSNSTAQEGSSSSTTANALNIGPTSSINENERDISDLPNVPLLRLLRKDDHPHYISPSARLPENTHPGNDGLMQPTFTLAKSRIRAYHTSCSTFMDLVDDPLPTDWQGKQRLRLRTGSRSLGPPLVYKDGPKRGLLRPPSEDLDIALTEMYRVPDITYWPAAQDPNHADEDIDAIYKLMNPPTHLGNVEGTADERSIVYVTGSHDEPQALIFINFDPAIKLAGLKRWGGLRRKGWGEEPQVNGNDNSHPPQMGDSGQPPKEKYTDVGELDRTVCIESKGKGKENARFDNVPMVHIDTHASTIVDVHGNNPSVPGVGGGRNKWAWKEKAMYRDINLGFDFGLGPKD